MAMEAAPTSPQLTTYAAQNTATVPHTVPASHTTVNLIQPEQGKGLYIVDPSQQHALQMFGSPDQRTFMANPVEFNAGGTITTTAVSSGNGQITMVSVKYRLSPSTCVLNPKHLSADKNNVFVRSIFCKRTKFSFAFVVLGIVGLFLKFSQPKRGLALTMLVYGDFFSVYLVSGNSTYRFLS